MTTRTVHTPHHKARKESGPPRSSSSPTRHREVVVERVDMRWTHDQAVTEYRRRLADVITARLPRVDVSDLGDVDPLRIVWSRLLPSLADATSGLPLSADDAEALRFEARHTVADWLAAS